MQVNLDWKDGMTFSGTTTSGHSLITSNDVDEAGNKLSFTPLELMAISIGACTGMDVISILQKKRQDVSDLRLTVHTEQAETFPKVWTEVNIKYIVTGKGIEPAAIERAIDLSAKKYCPTQNMINKTVEIQHSYEIIEA